MGSDGYTLAEQHYLRRSDIDNVCSGHSDPKPEVKESPVVGTRTVNPARSLLASTFNSGGDCLKVV